MKALPPMVGGRHDSGPCDCPAFDPEVGWHSAAQHDDGYCGGWGWEPPCGGCWNCVTLQVIHGMSPSQRRQLTPRPPMIDRPRED